MLFWTSIQRMNNAKDMECTRALTSHRVIVLRYSLAKGRREQLLMSLDMRQPFECAKKPRQRPSQPEICAFCRATSSDHSRVKRICSRRPANSTPTSHSGFTLRVESGEPRKKIGRPYFGRLDPGAAAWKKTEASQAKGDVR